jgi:gamma-glutamylcyclotransferase
MLYFAYGSNMDWSQMRERCPSARFFCVAKLKKDTLAFTRRSEKRGCGVSDVIPNQARDVWGVVYGIDARDLSRLDKCEGFVPGRRREDNAYFREERRVIPRRQ